jgi:hypothetical protein
MLFSNVNLICEGKDDRKGIFEILKKYQINPIPINGKSNMKSLMHQFEKIQEYFSIKVCYLYDLDYFNNFIYQSEKSKIYFLPCYSFENLLIDPYFIGKIYNIDPLEISDIYPELISEHKEPTLKNLLLAGIFKNNIPQFVRRFLDSVELDWTNDFQKKLRNEITIELRKILEKNIQIIKNFKLINPNAHNSFLNHLFLIQTYNNNYSPLLETELNKASVDWDAELPDTIQNLILSVISEEDFLKIFEKVKEINKKWQNIGFRFTEIKSWLPKFLEELFNKLKIPSDQKLSGQQLRKRYALFLTQNNKGNGISKEFFDLIIKISHFS